MPMAAGVCVTVGIAFPRDISSTGSGRPPVVKSSQGGGGASRALSLLSVLLPGQVSSIGDWRRKGR